ncbi:MAG: hypothetical protein Unbinned2706contig1001_38 [Prokaryotic dsDNA virus sp.]|nr:MAG: hypothetical protein Unbinned2706contig1001_38 [Prokaryotic dsDNA virus sp.]|tara:strand:+ start:10455 stop:11480 length:1026 start_codon:yes stop_codon:yes gene_type:complete
MSLGVTYDELHDEVGRALGYGRDATGDANVDVVACVKRGLRQFYTPEPLPGERVSHRWSFMRTVETLDTIVPSESGTASTFGAVLTSVSIDLSTEDAESISHVSVTRSNGATTKHLVTAVSNSGNTITVSAAFGYAESVSFTVFYNGSYALPAAFAGIDGPMTYDTFYGSDPNVADLTIEITTESKLRDMAQYLEDRDDKPRVAAVTQTGATGTAGTSQRINFYPIPDAVYRLKYTQINEPANLTSDSHVPLGGALHGETILASCLAIAEQFFIPNSPHGYVESYIRRLAASVEMDRQVTRSETLGYNADPSEFGSVTGFTDARLSRYLHDNRVTVNGVQY